MSVYYNEHDPFAAAWLKELIKAGEIPDGEVDTRDIQLVTADDVRSFTQCHWFAGIGGWALAARLAGWGDRPLWSGSCPCQPFSAAGKQKGGSDDRHLWPHWARLIRECKPATIVGEQVESAIAHGWLDAVFDDLEHEGYAVGAVDLPAASVGAFHRRQRIWFVADANGRRYGEPGNATGTNYTHGRVGTISSRPTDIVGAADRQEPDGNVGDSDDSRSQGWLLHPERAGECTAGATGVADELADAFSDERRQVGALTGGRGEGSGTQGPEQRPMHVSPWSVCTWLPCRDGKWRAVEPGTFPLAHGVSTRVGRLRGYGNAIVPAVAAEVLSALLEITEDR